MSETYPYAATIRDDGYGREYHGEVLGVLEHMEKIIFQRDNYYEKRMFDMKWWRIIPDE